jgi:hypothetical protein
LIAACKAVRSDSIIRLIVSSSGWLVPCISVRAPISLFSLAAASLKNLKIRM